MKATLDSVRQEALNLKPRQRAALAHELIASLDKKTEESTDEEWFAVMERRWKEIEEGCVVCRTAEDVFSDVRQAREARRARK